MKNLIVFACAILVTTGAGATNSFDGLYYPEGTDPPASCERIAQELHPGGMIIEDGTVYRTETSCRPIEPRQSAEGTEFVADCQAEGEPHRDLVTVERTPTGLRYSTRDHVSSWIECDPQSLQAAQKSRWVSGFAMGVSEKKITNDRDDSVVFSCGQGTPEPLVLIDIEGRPDIRGQVSITVDSRRFNFWASRGSIKINTECNECLETFGALMLSIFEGRTMTVEPMNRHPMSFSITGAKEAFYGEICMGAGHYVRERHRPCELIVKGRKIFSGQCSKNQDDDIIKYSAVGPGLFVHLILNDDRKTAQAYWNGGDGASHAHDDLGIMRRIGKCWMGGHSSVCFLE